MDDLREVRTRFLDKTMAYACSLRTELKVIAVIPAAVGLQVRLKLEGGNVFNVFPKDRMPGADGREHDVPKGDLRNGEETVLFRRSAVQGRPDEHLPSPASLLAGRALLGVDGIPVDVTYEGVLHWSVHPHFLFREAARGGPPRQDHAPADVRRPRKERADDERFEIVAKAFLAPVFDTSHPKYHWLTESTCLAFGVWTLNETFAIEHTATGDLDVYTTA